MPKFRKLPVTVDAVQYKGGNGWVSMEPWLKEAYEKPSGEKGHVWYDQDTGELRVQTLEGWQVASPEDWMIRGIKGEVYPCKPDVFAKTYEPAPD